MNLHVIYHSRVQGASLTNVEKSLQKWRNVAFHVTFTTNHFHYWLAKYGIPYGRLSNAYNFFEIVTLFHCMDHLVMRCGPLFKII